LAAQAYDSSAGRLAATGSEGESWMKGAIDFTKKSLSVSKRFRRIRYSILASLKRPQDEVTPFSARVWCRRNSQQKFAVIPAKLALASFCRETAKIPRLDIGEPWKMILSLLSRKWVAKESGGVRWSTQWSRRKDTTPRGVA